MGIKQPKWDIYEAVVLLDGYLEMCQSKQSRKQIIRRVSSDLRRMAVNRGLEIDEVFRNENGISYQIQSMDSAYKGEKVYVAATKLFEMAVEMYRTDPKRYLEILEEAKSMIAGKQNNKAAFLSWAHSALPAQRCKWIEENLAKIERFALSVDLISEPLFDISDVMVLERVLKATEKNKIFQLKNKKLIKNIDADFRAYIQFCAEQPDKTLLLTDVDSRVDELPTMQLSIDDISNILSPEEPQIAAVNETDFYQYLLNTAKLSERTCAVYISSIRSAERYASNNGYSSRALLNTNRETIMATAAELFGDPGFVRFNDDQHHRFGAAINKLLEFLGAEVPRKAAPSMGSHNKQASASAEKNTDIVNVLKRYYEYGFKYDSIRELMRFRQFADGMGIALPENDGELKASIINSGTLIDGKVYCKSDDMAQGLRDIVNAAFSSGANVIYYECLFEREPDWMSIHAITSPDMLKAYLQNNIEGCSFSKKFMVKGGKRPEKEAVTDEIKRVWGSRPIESVNGLKDRLPNIPLGNIWRVISGNDLFVFVSEGEYLFIDFFRISEDKEEDILDFVEEACDKNGFASLSDIPLGDIVEENYELSQPAIYNAIYKKVLSDKYHLSGRILTKEKGELDILTLLKQYIEGKEECSFDEVTGKAIELTGNANRRYVFQALYEGMVRVDKDRFVSTIRVSFPVDEIDSVLSGFITDHFRAIRDVSTFAMFPVCGQNWNPFLLESFCYKYSRRYSLRVIHFNDKNAGIIAEKNLNKIYDEMLAEAVARTDIELSPEIIGQYLFNTGYLAKSKYAKLDEIAQRAAELRKAK